MANRDLFVGGGLVSVQRISGGSASTDTSSYFSTYADHATQLGFNNEFRTPFVDTANAQDTVVAGEELWYHCVAYSYGTNGNLAATGPIMSICDASGYPLIALLSTGTSNFRPAINTGTGASPTWTQVGSNVGTGNTRVTFDIKVIIGSPHSYEFFVNDVSVAGGTFSCPTITTLTHGRHYGNANSSTGWSEVLAAVGKCTIGGHVFYAAPTAAGDANTMASGTYADVDEAGITDTDYTVATADGQKILMNYRDLPALGSTIAMGRVTLCTRARYSTSPAYLKPLRKVGGVETLSASIALGAGFADYKTHLAAMSFSDFTAAQFGYQASDT